MGVFVCGAGCGVELELPGVDELTYKYNPYNISLEADLNESIIDY